MVRLEILLAILCLLVVSSVTDDNHYLNEWAVEIKGGDQHARDIAKRYGFELIKRVPYLDDHYILRHNDVPHRSKRGSHEHTRRLIEEEQVVWAEQQVSKSRVKRSQTPLVLRRDGSLAFDDPLYNKQWYLHLRNPSHRELRGSSGRIDLHVEAVWRLGITGKNVSVSILDDGLEYNNTDIAANYDPYASGDLNDDDEDPIPRYDPTDENKHGTRCAGEIAMVANNGKCGVGIAFNSKIGGVRMLDGKVTDSLEAQALTYNLSHVDIYSASWGPNDDGVTVEGPGKMGKQALETGITKGRGGKGVIYAWASGNGGRMGDNCNCDGYTSSIYTLSVSSASEHGQQPWYGERCSSTMATAYSSGNGGDGQVVSADLHNGCTTQHTGTSAAAPMAAGIFALLLEANPNLTWRDVQHLVAWTSKVEPLSSVDGWYRNAAGFCVNLAFGFGLLDAKELVTEANPALWVNVPEKNVCTVSAGANSNFPQKLTTGNYVEVLIETNGCHGQESEVNFLEHVELVFSLNYSRRGAISATLLSPAGTETILLEEREWDKSTDGFKDWSLMSVHTWGERPNGTWRFRVYDKAGSNSEQGSLQDVKLILHGTKEMPDYRKSGRRHCTELSSTSPVATAENDVTGSRSDQASDEQKQLLDKIKDAFFTSNSLSNKDDEDAVLNSSESAPSFIDQYPGLVF